MKKKTYWMLAAAMTLAGCASDSDLNGGDDSAAEAAVAVSATRAAGTTDKESLAQGETFRLINHTRQLKGKTTKYDATYIVGADGNAMPQDATKYVVWQTGTYNGGRIENNEFRAVIPADADYDSHTLPTYQHDSESLKAADWQKATCTHSLDDIAKGITLNFEHQYAKLHFDITRKSDAIGTSINPTILYATKEINAYIGGNTIEAIVPPTEPTTPTPPYTIKIEIPGETFTASIPVTTFEAGKQYNFTLNIGHDAATISDVTVTNWTTTTIETSDEAVKNQEIPYVTFSAESEQTFRMSYASSSIGDNSEYSIGNGEWKKISTISTSSPVTFGGTHGDLRLRGKNENGTAEGIGSCSRIYFNNNGGDVSCSGDIRTLIDYENYKRAETKYAKFCKLFYECKVLTSVPKLPATNLAEECYYNMFSYCEKLTEAPELPATKLNKQCYRAMFEKCTSLTKAPDIKPQTVANECCYSMFQDCSNLTKAPEKLPATTLAYSCYQSMFSGCKALTSAPELPATTLADNCYYSMFYGCTALTSAPELPAMALADNCYYSMFRGCTALTEAPVLPAMTLANNCYSTMFRGCTALTEAPELPATTLANNCYNHMFRECTALTSVTMLADAQQIKSIYAFIYWLNNAGTSSSSRTLTLKNEDAYNELVSNSLLLDNNWKKGQATIKYKEQK